MMKLKLSLRNSVKTALTTTLSPQLKTLLLLPLLSIIPLLAVSCDTVRNPTYTTENLSDSLIKICQKEYSIPIAAKLEKKTLWVYLPLEEEIFIDSDKPQESTKIFEFHSIEGSLLDSIISFDYDIIAVDETKELQNKKINPKATKKMQKVFSALRRVILSLKHSADEPLFFVTVTADIKNGLELIEITYIDDLKKALYGMISITEYQHRSLQDLRVSFEAIGDKEGTHVQFQDIDFNDFLIEQIRQRVRSKFQRPEVPKEADIDKEVIKSISHVFEIYKFNGFSMLELKNLVTGNKLSLSLQALLEKVKEK